MGKQKEIRRRRKRNTGYKVDGWISFGVFGKYLTENYLLRLE